MRLAELARISSLAACGQEIALASPGGAARWSPDGGWVDLRPYVDAGEHAVLGQPGGLWVVGGTSAIRMRPGMEPEVLGASGRGGAPADYIVAADRGERWALLTDAGLRIEGAKGTVAPTPGAGRVSSMVWFAGNLVVAGELGLCAFDPADLGAGWRELECDSPARDLIEMEGALYFVDRRGAHRLGRDLQRLEDARDWFRLDGGYLWSGREEIVGFRDRLFVLAGTPSLRRWTPLPDPGRSVRTFHESQVRSVAAARSGTFVATSASGLLFLPAGEHDWLRVPVPGMDQREASDDAHLVLGDDVVWLASGSGLWRIPDVADGWPRAESVARAFLVFPTGPDPELAGTMLFDDDAGAAAAGAVFADGALWYAWRAVPGEFPGVLYRATASEQGPVVAEPRGPPVLDVVADAGGRVWVVREDRATHLSALLQTLGEESDEVGTGTFAPSDTLVDGEAFGRSDTLHDGGGDAEEADEGDEDAAADEIDDEDVWDPDAEDEAGLKRRIATQEPPDTVAVGTEANSLSCAAAYASAAEIEDALHGYRPRSIRAIAFTFEAALVATAGGADPRQPLGRRERFIHKARLIHIGLEKAADELIDVADNETYPEVAGIRAIAHRGREIWLATAYGLKAFWRKGRGESAGYEQTSFGAPGVSYPPFTQLQFVHAGRDRLIHDGFAWKRFGEDTWYRWSGDELQRYAGEKRLEYTYDPFADDEIPDVGPPVKPQPLPYDPATDPGWVKEEEQPEGLTVDSNVVTSALETASSLWIGTDAGIVRYDEDSKSYETVDRGRCLSTEGVTSLRESEGHVIISTIDGVFILRGA